VDPESEELNKNKDEIARLALEDERVMCEPVAESVLDSTFVPIFFCIKK
jgi:hypothetical protein